MKAYNSEYKDESRYKTLFFLIFKLGASIGDWVVV